MKAMVLAAGLGTRLGVLTSDRPKALVELGGRTLLEITLARLRAFGIQEVIINVHHFADAIEKYLKRNHDFGMRIEVSREDVLLDTGGGLKKAAWFFEDSEPFALHNVDVISTIDLNRMLKFHIESHALATLAVKDRKTSRPLLFDDRLQLCGRPDKMVRPAENPQALAFSGIHIISPRFLRMLNEEGAFSIIGSYLRLASTEKILGFRSEDYWRDLGKPADLDQAAGELEKTKNHAAN